MDQINASVVVGASGGRGGGEMVTNIDGLAKKESALKSGGI